MEYNRETNISINEAVYRLESQVKKENPNALKTGFSNLDIITDGFSPGELCVIGARPAMGKTMFVFSLISYMLWQNIPVGLFSADDNLNVNYLSRLISAVKYTKPPYTYEQRVKLIQNTTLEDVPLYLNIEQRMDIAYLRENAIKMKEENGIKCLFIETIQSLFENEENGTSKEGTEKTCRELRILAQELNIPIIITSDLNRGPENRPGIDGKIPQIRDLRYGDSIECYADKVFLLYRPEYYHICLDDEGYDLRGILTVVIAKNTYGSTGSLRLKVNNQTFLVTDIGGSMRDDVNTFKEIVQNNSALQSLSDKMDLEILKEDPPF